jgi:hypothetical protein
MTFMENPMRYHLAPIYCRPWLLNGLSFKLIESHYEKNYGGALDPSLPTPLPSGEGGEVSEMVCQPFGE